MKLSDFKPVMVCTACEAVIVVWETQYRGNIGNKTTWYARPWIFDKQPVRNPDAAFMAAHWACCSACGAAPLTLRPTTARHSESVWYNPMSWYGDRQWFLAEHLKLTSRSGSVSLTSDEP